MLKDTIKKRANLTKRQEKIEEYFINDAILYTNKHLETYKKDPYSLKGKYICSDLMKRTFTFYNENKLEHNELDFLIHNSAASLTDELFQEIVIDKKIKDCFFVAGIPGAGKSFFIQTLIFEEKISPTTMIYEGSIITDTIIDKIKLALKNKKKIHLIIINPTLNLAYENILNRQRKTGRGASLETMANIYSNLYNAVMRLYQIFGNELNIKIYSKTKNDEMKLYTQVHDINQLKTESYKKKKKKLKEIRKKA